VRFCLVAIVLSAALLSGTIAARAQSGRSPAASEEAAPAKIQELLALLADPKVQQWLERQGQARATAGSPAEHDSTIENYLNSRAGSIHKQMVALADAIPGLPDQFIQAAARDRAVHGEYGRAWVLLNLLVFGVLGFGAEWLFKRMTRGMRRHLDDSPMETVHGRLRLLTVRLAHSLGTVVAFALGSIGLFFALDWAPALRGLVLGYLIAFVVIRGAAAIGDFLLAPDQEPLRIIPMDTAAARFWGRRLVVFVGWFALGWLIVQDCSALGFSFEGLQIVAYTLGLGVVALALEAVWRGPIAPREAAEPSSSEVHPLLRSALSIGIVLMWVLWMTEPGIDRVGLGFWFILVCIVLPLTIFVTRHAIQHLLRPPGASDTAEGPPNVLTVCLERGVRALLIIGAVAVLAWAWNVNLLHLAGQDTLFARIVHGVLSAVIILLVADVLWRAVKAAIDRKLAETADLGQPNTDEGRRRARLQTLLPILSNVLFVVFVVVAGLMALSAMGVEIGPLIAGAGVIGIAVGFGAQTFVRDVIAGMFFLLDDAFRVGEYIQAGNFKGTVEGFSIRSVKLRHHRGPVYTVPFGLLGAVQNQSRDWVIDKMMVGITYDSDLERARKLIKQIGLDLAKDPEFAPLILQPLKMQGVEHFGDFAVQIRMKMMTLPGEQFVIRRKAYAMIKKAFDENGIKFAFPTVQVASDADPSTAAVAQHAIELTRPTAA
jgi:small-conductance mechanosensitive channel